MKQVLTVAGSDSGGGAGIQADLKTFHAHGVFGASVLTAITAQNTVAVTDAFELPCELIDAQLDAVFEDFDIAAVKTGMLSSAAIVEAVAAGLRKRKVERLVVDPVMISKSGFKLLKGDAVNNLKMFLLPLALVVTPNIHEAELLAGHAIDSMDAMKDAARRIRDYGPRHVLVKGGHAEFNRATDVLFDGVEFHLFQAPYIDTSNLHGTGCTYSAAITARVALGEPLAEAIKNAKTYITRAIENALDIGQGHGPTNHFYFLTPRDFLEE
ncbi:MAG: bifunctional hydroxymethylpyrimidine kinase/phosphomethylpyrimidine kinase [Candidatus Latescibacterota bacterium]|nr:MAG: bifunctional hydroxymethylpyrimidine kinase/phosphomethylpyrimidine kinase [Candidatus Latescibacterota bacterium]